jgi:hypothetical protein
MARKTGKMVRAELDNGYEAKRKRELAEYGGFEKYEVDGWARTLQEAAEIISDPKKMKAVSRCIAKKEESMATLKAFAVGKGKQSSQDRADS